MSVQPVARASTLPPEQSRLLETLLADEPEWHRIQRARAAAVYASLPVPERPRTPLKGRRLESIPYLQPTAPHAVEPAVLNLAGGPAWAVLSGNRVAALHLDDDLLQRGVRFEPLREALPTLPDSLASVLGSLQPDDEDRYTALNRAFWSVGLLCYVPAGLVIDEPLSVVHWVDAEVTGYLPRILVVAEAGARVHVVETYLGSTDDTHRVLVSSVVEVLAREGASVTWSAIQQLPSRAEAFLRRRGRAERDAHIRWHTAEFGSSLSVAGHATDLVGAGSSATSVSVFFGTGTQHQDYTAQVSHRGPHTRSDILARGVMAERSRSIFTGQSLIAKGAVKSDARQREQTLMLSPDARADAIPSLVIDDNDVFAAHAASAGPIDALALHYLESRGLSPREAKRLVVRGFLAPVLEKLAPEALRLTVEEAVERKLTTLGGDDA